MPILGPCGDTIFFLDQNVDSATLDYVHRTVALLAQCVRRPCAAVAIGWRVNQHQQSLTLSRMDKQNEQMT